MGTYIKKVLALESKTVKEVAEQIDLINAGGSQRMIATMWTKVTPDGTSPAKHDALLFYEVDYKALESNTKVKLPSV